MALTKVSGNVIQDGIVISGIITATEFEGNLTGTASTATASATAYGLSGAPDIIVGITTATGFVGDVAGNLTGNVTGDVAGNLTGNVTGDVNSSGVSTFSNVVVGGATTELIVNGDTRITGIITIGESSVTINGNTNTISGINSVTDNSGGYLTIPPGAVQFFARDTAPNGWVKANGASLSSTTYADLFAAIGYTFGGSGGSFTLPDLRGEFPRGWDDSRGIDSGRGFGTAQAFGIPRMIGGVADSHGFSAMQPINVGGYTNPFYGSGTSSWRTQISNVNTNYSVVYFDSARIIANSSDVRPRNIALLACIKY